VRRLRLPANPGGVVYGTILVATLLAAESPRRETYVKTIGAVVVALLVYWLSAAYAQLTGERIRDEAPFTAAGFARAAAHERPVMYGALGPLLALLICWAAGAGLGTAVAIAIWASAAIIVATEVMIGVRTDLTGRELVLQTAMGVLLGLFAEALRVLLH
jgi:hypothetical protein